MKKIIFIAFNLFWGTCFAQNLHYSYITKFDDPICTYGETDACVTIVAEKSLQLGFSSNYDKDIIARSDTVGEFVYTILHFRTQGYDFSKRVLTIISPKSSIPIEIALDNLYAKSSDTYLVELNSCYKPAFDEGLLKFNAGAYEDAKTLFKQAQQCKYDKPSDGIVEKKLLDLDSILIWQMKATENVKLLNFSEASIFYSKIYQLNPRDENNNKKWSEAENQNDQFCRKYFEQAHKYYYYHEYEKALILFRNVSYNNCIFKDSADVMISKIAKTMAAHKDKREVFTYELGLSSFLNPDLLLPIGFQIGTYNTKKTGFYWSVFANSQIINAMSKKYPKSIKGNFGSTIGITFRPIPTKYDKIPVWLHLGVGYSLMSNFVYEEEDADGNTINYNGETTDQKLKFKPYHAIPFEVGTTVKIWYFVLRYTFQYRVWFPTDTDTDIPAMCEPYIHKVGIGFCW